MSDDDWDTVDDILSNTPRGSTIAPKKSGGALLVDFSENGECEIELPYEGATWWNEEKPSLDSPGHPAGYDELDRDVEKDFKALKASLAENGFALEKDKDAVAKAVEATEKNTKKDLEDAKRDPDSFYGVNPRNPTVTLCARVRKMT